MIVGIAETGDYLTGGHPSIHRCLRETKLERMTDEEIAEAVFVGIAMSAGAAAAHSCIAIDSMKK